MKPQFSGQLLAVVAALSFGLSGVFIKPLLEAGWSPAAAVTVRALIGGLALLPLALLTLRGKWTSLWRGRWRVLGMGLIGVGSTQLFYFAAVQRIPVGTAILMEYMAPLLLVALAWATTRKMPKVAVLVGSVIALSGLVLIVSPGGSGGLDLLGLFFAAIAMIGCAAYFVISARPSDDLPPVALAAAGLLIGAALLGIASAVGVVPFSTSFADVEMMGSATPWWVPMLVVGLVATALAYATSIAASGILGSRMASFLGLLEVAAAGIYAWLLLDEALGPVQILGGALILTGIGFVQSDKTVPTVPLEPASEIVTPEVDPPGVGTPGNVGSEIAAS